MTVNAKVFDFFGKNVKRSSTAQMYNSDANIQKLLFCEEAEETTFAFSIKQTALEKLPCNFTEM